MMLHSLFKLLRDKRDGGNELKCAQLDQALIGYCVSMRYRVMHEADCRFFMDLNSVMKVKLPDQEVGRLRNNLVDLAERFLNVDAQNRYPIPSAQSVKKLIQRFRVWVRMAVPKRKHIPVNSVFQAVSRRYNEEMAEAVTAAIGYVAAVRKNYIFRLKGMEMLIEKMLRLFRGTCPNYLVEIDRLEYGRSLITQAYFRENSFFSKGV